MNPASSGHDNKTCIVLGGRGFVGSAIVRAAEARGYAVTIVEKDDYDSHIGVSATLLINANGNSRKYLAKREPGHEFDLSVRSVMRSLHDFKTDRYVHISTIDVYPDHENPAGNAETQRIDVAGQAPYGYHKYVAEQLVRYYARDWLIFRMAGFVGQGLWKNSIFDLLQGKPLHVHPDSEYQYLNTDDMARMLFDIVHLNRRREFFNIAGDGTIKIREVAAMIPGCRLDEQWNTLPRERYEVNIDKIKSLLPVPATKESVSAFIRKELAGQGERK